MKKKKRAATILTNQERSTIEIARAIRRLDWQGDQRRALASAITMVDGLSTWARVAVEGLLKP